MMIISLKMLFVNRIQTILKYFKNINIGPIGAGLVACFGVLMKI